MARWGKGEATITQLIEDRHLQRVAADSGTAASLLASAKRHVDSARLYARCAELLLRKWDEQRDLYRKLGSDHLVEPTLRYLAWWLFTREDTQAAATEHELIAKTSEFLYERGYETEEQAGVAAREFVEFCRGRMWVFSDAGTTADGEKLYGFTHRTFMEYFTALHLAMLEFLCACLPSARPAPATVRNLARAALDHATQPGEPVYLGLEPLLTLLSIGDSYAEPIADELGKRIAEMTTSDEAPVRTAGIRLLFSICDDFDRGDFFNIRRSFWKNWFSVQLDAQRAEIFSAADRDEDIRVFALAREAITAEDALAMPGGLTTLATIWPVVFEGNGGAGAKRAPYLVSLVGRCVKGSQAQIQRKQLPLSDAICSAIRRRHGYAATTRATSQTPTGLRESSMIWLVASPTTRRSKSLTM